MKSAKASLVSTLFGSLVITSPTASASQNGAVGLYFFFICGLLVAVVNHRYTRYEETSLLSEMKPVRGAALFAFSGLFLALVLAVQVSVLIAVGIPGTDMSAYSLDFGGPLTLEQIDALTKYLRSLEEFAPDFPGWREPLENEPVSFPVSPTIATTIESSTSVKPASRAASQRRGVGDSWSRTEVSSSFFITLSSVSAHSPCERRSVASPHPHARACLHEQPIRQGVELRRIVSCEGRRPCPLRRS